METQATSIQNEHPAGVEHQEPLNAPGAGNEVISTAGRLGQEVLQALKEAATYTKERAKEIISSLPTPTLNNQEVLVVAGIVGGMALCALVLAIQNPPNIHAAELSNHIDSNTNSSVAVEEHHAASPGSHKFQ